MVRSIVIPHDPARSLRVGHLVTAGVFQATVDGWLEPIEMPALVVTVYVYEAARREHHPIDCRAMALWWLYSADPMPYPNFLGDVVITGSGGTEQTSDLPAWIVEDIFEQRAFVVQVQPYATGPWRDTLARFESIFDAAPVVHAVRPHAAFWRVPWLCSRTPDVASFDESFGGVGTRW